MGSGTMIVGSDAFVTGISGSDEVGPTWAGATELAVAAAKNQQGRSKRKQHIIRIQCGEPPIQARDITFENMCSGLVLVPRLAWHLPPAISG